MEDIIIMNINKKEAKLVLIDSDSLAVIYDNNCIESGIECRVNDVLEEKWIGEALIKFAVHNYIFKIEHKEEFDKLVELLD